MLGYPYYIVYGQRWNSRTDEYESAILGIYEENNYEAAVKHFNKITPNSDLIQVELWEEREEDNKRLAYKVSLSDGYDEVWGE